MVSKGPCPSGALLVLQGFIVKLYPQIVSNNISMKVSYLTIAFFCVLLICTSCTNIPQPVWQKVTIDSTISRNKIFSFLDKQRDNHGPLPNDTPGIKTSDVSYINDRVRNINDSTYAKINNCEAFVKADTIMINIGSSNLFSGSGFMINYTSRHFLIEPYSYSDVILEKDAPTFQWVYQRLKLDKPAYKINDSLHGYVSFKIIENDNGQIITHIGDGYFRSKIKSWDF
ncbi:MAG: hypothetical protein ABIN95_06520 [Mucilaginibacter sp.]